MPYKDTFNFSNKNVVITGGLGQIGYEVSRAFLEYGAKVIVADINEGKFKELQTQTGGERVFFMHFDIAKIEQIFEAISNIVSTHGRISTWVNTAYPRTADWGNKLEEVVVASWDQNLREHLGGYFWTSKCILEHMKEQGGGSLINFGSIYGVVGPNFSVYDGTEITMPVAYAAIKGALINLTRYFAAYYGKYNIRVNTICPGGVFNNQPFQFVEQYSKLTPLGRMAKAEELSMPTLFLASDAASYITGHILMVDGGWTVW